MDRLTPDYLHTLAASLDIMAQALTIDSYNAVNGYRNELRSLVNQQDDSEDKTKEKIIALLILFALLAFQEGLAESGSTSGLTLENKAAVTKWVNGQQQFAAGLAEAIAQLHTLQRQQTQGQATVIEVETAAAEVNTRIEMWSDTLSSLKLQGAYEGGLRDGDDPLCIYVLGPTEEHCRSEKTSMGCLDLSQHLPEKLSWFVLNGYVPRLKGNENITCGGWRCQCKIVRVSDGKQMM